MRRLSLLAGLALLAAAPAFAEEAAPGKPTFNKDVKPLLEKYCLACHGPEKTKGNLRLDKFTEETAAKDEKTWQKVSDNLRSGDMPPPGRKRPTPDELDGFNTWLDVVVFKLDCSGEKNPGRVTLHRLNRFEYVNTVRDLIGVDFQAGKDFPVDDSAGGFDNNADNLSLTPLLLEKYLAAAEQVVDQAWKDPEVRKRITNPRDNFVGPPGPLERGPRRALRLFAERAYRRPVSDEEVRRFASFVQTAARDGKPEEGFKLAVTAMLCSPHFLFRVERDDPSAPNGITTLNEWELASRLSYFLWASMPDEELFELCRQGKLRDNLEKQVRRMLKDPKADRFVENFAGQWLQSRNLLTLTPDKATFPSFDEKLRAAMMKEPELYFAHVLKEDRPILEFLDSDYTFVNERLAKHYGIPGVKGDEFRKVTLADRTRGGVLTQASVLTVTSNPTRTSPVKRGKWILENILGTPPPPPPPGVEELAAGKDAELKGSLRQRMEQHRANPSCASCHQRMDPIGFGFENFDAVGAYRTKDGKHDVDSGGTLATGEEFKGPAELKKLLVARKDLFARCLTEKMLTYALGRSLERDDRCTIDDIARDLAKQDYRMSRLILDVVQSDAFQKRKGKPGGGGK